MSISILLLNFLMVQIDQINNFKKIKEIEPMIESLTTKNNHREVELVNSIKHIVYSVKKESHNTESLRRLVSIGISRKIRQQMEEEDIKVYNLFTIWSLEKELHPKWVKVEQKKRIILNVVKDPLIEVGKK